MIKSANESDVMFEKYIIPMKERLAWALENMKKYNDGVMFQECFGFEPDVEYDALVVAPGWKPTKIIRDPAYKVTVLSQHSNELWRKK